MWGWSPDLEVASLLKPRQLKKTKHCLLQEKISHPCATAKEKIDTHVQYEGIVGWGFFSRSRLRQGYGPLSSVP
jgi:hypothetical protein